MQNIELSKLSDEAISDLIKSDELYHEITCKEDVLKILCRHEKMLGLLSDMVGLLARAENHRIDRIKSKNEK